MEGGMDGSKSWEAEGKQVEESDAENRGSSVFVPRLELDLSNDDIQIDVSSEPSTPFEKHESTGRRSGREEPKTNDAILNAPKIQGKIVSVEAQMIAVLEKCLTVPKEKAKPGAGMIVNTLQGNTLKSQGDPRIVTILRHLRFVQTWSVAVTCTNDQSKSDDPLGPMLAGIGICRWWQRRPRVTKKEMLKISTFLLEKYYNFLTAKLEEASIITEEILLEQEINKVLHVKISKIEQEKTELVMAIETMTTEKVQMRNRHARELQELRNASMENERAYTQSIEDNSKSMNDLKRQWQEEVDMLKAKEQGKEQEVERMKHELEKKVVEKEGLKNQYKKLLDKCELKSAESKEREKEIETNTVEKEEIKRQYKKLLDKYNELKTAKNEEMEKETERLKFELKVKQEENRTLVAGLKQAKDNFVFKESKMELEIMNLREGLALREQQLNEIKDRFGNQIACEAGFVKEEASDALICRGACEEEDKLGMEETGEGTSRSKIDCLEEPKKQPMTSACIKHGHFLDKIMPQESPHSDKVNAFAFLKIGDVWQEQISCHEDNVEKLKEMQKLRKNLIASRQDLEKSIKENLSLKESIVRENGAMEKRLKELMKHQSYEVEKKDEEIENLKLELVTQKNTARKLSKELTKNLLIQKCKDEEIELLNATVKAEHNDEYCIVTTESMMNFKKHIEKLRQENNGLLGYCDRVEEKVSETKRELNFTRKLGSELSIREMDSQKICKEMMSEVDVKTRMLRQAKEKIRVLTRSYEEVKEDAADSRQELDNAKEKLARMKKKIVAVEREKRQLEEEKSKLAKDLAQTVGELQKSVDMVCQMKIRYEHFEERFKEKEGKTDELLGIMVTKDKEIKRLLQEVEEKEHENGMMKKQIQEAQTDKGAEMFKTEKYEEDVERLTCKLEHALQDVDNERLAKEAKQKEVQRLVNEITGLTEKLEEIEQFGIENKQLLILENKIAVLEEENNSMKEKNQQAREDIKELEKEAEGLKFEREIAESENKKLFDELKTQEKLLAENEKVVKELEDELQKIKSSVTNVQSREQHQRNSTPLGVNNELQPPSATETTDTSMPQRNTVERKEQAIPTYQQSADNSKGKVRKQKSEARIFSSDEDDDSWLASGYVPSSTPTQGPASRNAPQKNSRPSWLQDSTPDSPSSEAKQSKRGDITDSFDDFQLKNTRRSREENYKGDSKQKTVGRSAGGRDNLFFLSDEGDDLNRNGSSGRQVSEGRRIESRNRRREQSGDDAASELKKLVGF